MPWAVNGSSAPKSLGRQKLFQLEGLDPQGNTAAAKAWPLSLLLRAQPWHRRGQSGLGLSLLVGVGVSS